MNEADPFSVQLCFSLSVFGGIIMNNGQENMIIRRAAEDDVWQIADILVEDWKTAYRGIIDSEYLDSMSVEERYRRELSER